MRHIKISPTILFLMTFIVGICLSWFLPLKMTRFIAHEVTQMLGLTFLLTSFILNSLAYRMFKHHSTPHLPHSVPTVLIETGVFAFSRNPVYVALILSEVGLAFIFDRIWLVLSAAALWISLDIMIVRDEERVLENTFKQDYMEYKNKTRRWV
ncbi:MAG TPA: isoprenylcysteine carboxylmethyltransferase family protein [Sulfurovum sp.]